MPVSQTIAKSAFSSSALASRKGNSDGDPDSLAVARREAEEETGLQVAPLGERVFDLDVHEIPARGDDPAHYHFDVRFAFRAAGEAFAVSAESLELAWVPIAGLDAYTREESVLRMARKRLPGFG